MVKLSAPRESQNDDAFLRRLRVFKTVVDCGGVGEAARALGVSQPAVSTQILRLEDHLGVSLFRRTGRRLVVTDQGRQVAEILQTGLGEVSRMLNAVRDASRSQVALLRFGFSAPQIALDAAARFRRTDPRTQLELRAANSRDLLVSLDHHELDVIMIGLPAPKAPYHCQFFRRQIAGVQVPCAHAMAGRKSVALRDLADQPLVLREPGSYTRDVILAAFEALALAPRIAFEVATREAVAEAVRHGFGVGPVLSREAPTSDDLTFIPLESGRIEAREFLVCHRSTAQYGPIKRFFAANTMVADSEV